MQQITILGDGALGRAVEVALVERSRSAGRPTEVLVLGRPRHGRHDPEDLGRPDLVIEASRPEAVVANVQAAMAAGARQLIVATTGWGPARPRLDALLRETGAAAVAAPNFSLGVALFGRLVETAVELFGPLDAFDPFLLEWHRRAKRDRPSGTALDLARRIVDRHPRLGSTDELEVASIRAGASPGMHLVGFDAGGETVELRLTARDRSAYAAGILTTADWLERGPRPAGLHAFDLVIDELIARRPIAA